MGPSSESMGSIVRGHEPVSFFDGLIDKAHGLMGLVEGVIDKAHGLLESVDAAIDGGQAKLRLLEHAEHARLLVPWCEGGLEATPSGSAHPPSGELVPHSDAIAGVQPVGGMNE
jgi:hypothetical protein